MALSADTPRVYELGEYNKFGVLASATIYEGSAVGLSSGYARALTAGDPFVGFARRKVVEATAVNGGADVEVICKGLMQVTLASVAVTDVGNAVYMSDDGTFTQTKGSNSFVGNVYRYVAANTCVISFIGSGVAYGAVAAGGTLASAQILVGNGSNVAAACAVSGDISITNAGVTAIGANKVLTAMISDGQITYAKLAASALSSIVSLATSLLTSHVSSSAH